MYSKTLEKQVTYKTPKGVEKQLDYMLVDKNTEANDMIHMGSDHRSVMAQFVITASTNEVSPKMHIEKKKTTTAADGRMRPEKATNMFEERYVELESKIKQEAESAATTQKPKEIESAAHNLGDDANAAAASHNLGDDADAAAHNLGEDANAAAAHNLGEDANAPATKEKAKKSRDMQLSQNSKNEKIKERDDEIRAH